jgi:hypothetical protein
MEYQIISSKSPQELTKLVMKLIGEGWRPMLGHTVVETHRYNRFSGTQHRDTIIELEYTQTMIKD